MAGSTTHRSSRGRSHARGRKKLPPIPERSLSNQKLGASSGGGGIVEGVAPSAESKKTQDKHTRTKTVAPSPESRKSTPQMVGVAEESRDDEYIPQVLTAIANNQVDVKPDVKPVEEICVPPPPSPRPAAAESSFEEIESAKETISIHEPPALDEAELASVLSAKPPALEKPAEEASVASSRETHSLATSLLDPPIVSEDPMPTSIVANISQSTTQATQTNCDAVTPPPVTFTSSPINSEGVMLADNLADAITPYMSNVSRKRIEAMVGTACDDGRTDDTAVKRVEANAKKYSTEPSLKDFQHARSESTEGTAYDPPEILSIPTDEIMDSFMKKPKSKSNGDDCSNVSDEEMMDYNSRETRDNYQLGRLQARINRRRELGHRQIPHKEDNLNYQTLRSSRIKTVRNLYSTPHRDTKEEQPSPPSSETKYDINQEYQVPVSSGASSVYGSIAHASSIPSIANQTFSTIPSLKHGQTISRSMTSSVSGFEAEPLPVSHHSGAQSFSQSNGDDSSIVLSEYRGKLFAKMLDLLQDLSPTKQALDDDDVSNIKERVLDESRASCCSVAELKLIQKMTEEEMSRILSEFEQNNSLVEKKESIHHFKNDPVANNYCRMERLNVGGNNEKEVLNFPHKIMYHDNSLSIASKVSDVTSPTCHDGFELDEIAPVPHRPMLPPSSPRSSGHHHSHHKNRLPPLASLSPSPAAAAAASVAASMSLSATGNSTREQHSQHQLPCVLEIPDMIELNEDNDKIAKIEKKFKQQLVVKEKEDEHAEFQDEIKKDENEVSDAIDLDDSTPVELAEEAEVCEERESAEDSIHDTSLIDLIEARSGDDEDTGSNLKVAEDVSSQEEAKNKIKAAKVLALSRESVRRAAEEENFHDEILGAVAKAAASAKRVEDDFELWEVTSILSQYEEAEKKVKEQVGALKATAGSQPVIDEENDATSLSLFDESAPIKTVAFLEPVPPTVEDQAICGCAIQ